MKDKSQLKQQAQQASLCYQNGEYAKARELLEDLLQHQVKSSSLYNQLGNVCQKQRAYDTAEKYYRDALHLQPDYVEAMYNLALALRAQKKSTETVAALMSILEIAPHYYQAHFLLGKLLLEKKLPEEADLHFQEVAKIALASDSPESETILYNLLAALFEHDAYKLAKHYCNKLLELNNKNVEALYNLGVIAARERDLERAKTYYKKVLDVDDKHFASINNLAVIYLEQQDLETAKTYFRRALTLQPNNEAIQYTLNAITGENPQQQAPQGYLKNLFNQYALHYDIHLREGLNYRVPELLKEAILSIKQSVPNQWDILDLGCGTGLAGEVFKPWARDMVGVDVADKMLDEARKKACYSTLVAEDMVKYLEGCQRSFDLVLAADVLIYMGNLDKLFQFITTHLNDRAIFAFSIELEFKKDYRMQLSGRFSHSKNYIKELAKQHKLKVVYFESATTRKQRKQDVPGAIVVLENT